MTETKYRFNTARLFALWLMPAFFTFVILVLFSIQFEINGQLTLIGAIAWSVLFIFTVGIFGILFLNHLPIARRTQLIVVGKTFQIIQNNQSHSANFDDIVEIVEYSSKKLPWGFIMKWKIKVAKQEFVISSLTISQFNFEQHFHNRIKHKISLLPTI